MSWVFCETLPDLRWCGYCLQPWPASLAYFARHKYGRHNLSSVCRWCANQDRAIRYRLARENTKWDYSPCGANATSCTSTMKPISSLPGLAGMRWAAVGNRIAWLRRRASLARPTRARCCGSS